MAAGGSEARYSWLKAKIWPFLIDRKRLSRSEEHVRVKPWGYDPLNPEAAAAISALGPQAVRARPYRGAILPIPADRLEACAGHEYFGWKAVP